MIFTCAARHAGVVCTVLALSFALQGLLGVLASSSTCLTERQGSTWAIIVSTSSAWHDYRHALNALSVYEQLSRLCVPAEQMVLMLGGDYACNARNPFPGEMRSAAAPFHDLYPHGAQIVREITVSAVLSTISGDAEGSMLDGVFKGNKVPEGASLVVYMTGHGGDGFLKFQDWDEMTAEQLASAVARRAARSRTSRILLIIDTCQAASLFPAISTPGFLGLASSEVGQNSYSHHVDGELGLAAIDRFTFHLHAFLSSLQPCANASVHDLLAYMRSQDLRSTMKVFTEGLPRDLSTEPLTNFLGCPRHRRETMGGTRVVSSGPILDEGQSTSPTWSGADALSDTVPMSVNTCTGLRTDMTGAPRGDNGEVLSQWFARVNEEQGNEGELEEEHSEGEAEEEHYEGEDLAGCATGEGMGCRDVNAVGFLPDAVDLRGRMQNVLGDGRGAVAAKGGSTVAEARTDGQKVTDVGSDQCSKGRKNGRANLGWDNLEGWEVWFHREQSNTDADWVVLSLVAAMGAIPVFEVMWLRWQ